MTGTNRRTAFQVDIIMAFFSLSRPDSSASITRPRLRKSEGFPVSSKWTQQLGDSLIELNKKKTTTVVLLLFSLKRVILKGFFLFLCVTHPGWQVNSSRALPIDLVTNLFWRVCFSGSFQIQFRFFLLSFSFITSHFRAGRQEMIGTKIT